MMPIMLRIAPLGHCAVRARTGKMPQIEARQQQRHRIRLTARTVCTMMWQGGKIAGRIR
jgi:hypothetical protein